MALSVFDLFKIGIGPSSSHTVGPMKAAALFAHALRADGQLSATARVEVRLYGSLGATGKGHGTDTAVMLGLEGAQPDTIDPDGITERLKSMRSSKTLCLGGEKTIAFAEKTDVLFLRRETLSYHPNGVKFMAFDGDGTLLQERRYFSVGGGFVVSQEDADAHNASTGTVPRIVPDPTNAANKVAKVVKSAGAELWAGTTVSTCAGNTLVCIDVSRSAMFFRNFSVLKSSICLISSKSLTVRRILLFACSNSSFFVCF